MENVQTAIQHAYDARPAEFKNSILEILSVKLLRILIVDFDC